MKTINGHSKRGHRIELHIHPHWVNAVYNGDGTWNYDDYSHYSLYSFTEDEVTSMFKEGTELLNKIAHKVDPNYKVIAFRAGGWTVQPFSKLKKDFGNRTNDRFIGSNWCI